MFKINVYLLLLFVSVNIFSNEEIIKLWEKKTPENLLTIVQYSKKNKIKIDIVTESLTKYLKVAKTHKLYKEILINSFMYCDNLEIFNIIKDDKEIFMRFINFLINNDLQFTVLNDFLIKEAFDLKQNATIKEILAKYLLKSKILTNNKPFFDYIEKIHANNTLNFKEDEIYVSVIIPLIAENYKKNDFDFYKNMLNTDNLIMIQTVIYAISLTEDKDFIPFLEKLENEDEIKIAVKKALYSLKKEEKEIIDTLP